MKRKISTAIFLCFLFLVLVVVVSVKPAKVPHKILKVVEADKFYIDLNDNNKIDDDELFRIKNIVAFSPEKSRNISKYLLNLQISEQEYLKVGYLARAWAKEELINKDVFITSNLEPLKQNEKYRFADIEYKGENLAQALLINGLAFVYEKCDNNTYFQFLNTKQIKNNAKEMNKLEFVFANKNSNIAHSLFCEYFSKIQKGELILKKHLEFLNFKLCKFCLKENEFQIKFPKFAQSKNKYPKSINKTFLNVELFLINPLEFDKPSSDCRTDICKKIVSEINSSKKNIDIALYGINEQKEIVDALRNAQKRGVEIKVVMDKSLNTEKIYPETLMFAQEFRAKTDSVKTLMHNKFIIFDNQKVMTGSLNISSSGSGGYNSNSVVFVNSKEVSSYYKKEFEQMYSGKFSTNKAKIEINKELDIVPYFSPNGDVYREGILPLIQNAKRKIYLSAFYFTDRNLINELISAKNRGIEILVILDSVGATNFKDRVVSLRAANIPTKVENWGGKNHEKTIMVDDEILLIGSCNFSLSGFNKNDENFLIIKNPEMAKFYGDYFLYLFNSIDNKFLKLIPRAESFDSKNSCYDGIDNNFDGKIDSEDEGCIKK